MLDYILIVIGFILFNIYYCINFRRCRLLDMQNDPEVVVEKPKRRKLCKKKNQSLVIKFTTMLLLAAVFLA